jgi:hypothetical protein
MPMKKTTFWLPAAFFFLAVAACTQHKVEVAPVEIKPIHITIDVNVKVDRALDDFFSDIDNAEENIETEPSASE